MVYRRGRRRDRHQENAEGQECTCDHEVPCSLAAHAFSPHFYRSAAIDGGGQESRHRTPRGVRFVGSLSDTTRSYSSVAVTGLSKDRSDSGFGARASVGVTDV
jgi:hypothetical protein